MISKPVQITPLPDRTIQITFQDGTEGVVSLMHLQGKGVFNQWDVKVAFNQVFIHPETHAIAWNDELEISPDALYLKIKGLTFEQWQNQKNAAA